MEPRALGGADAKEIGDAGGLSARLGERLSHLERDRLRKLIDRPRDELGSLPHDLGALVRREIAHRARSLCRRRERPLRLGRARDRDGVDHRAVVGVHDLLLAGGSTPLAGDVHLHQASPLGAPNPI